MPLEDINKCTVRTLTTKTGLPFDIACKIIEYKRKRKERPAIKHLDELWKIEGMTCPLFQKLMQNYKTCNSSSETSTPSITVTAKPRVPSQNQNVGRILNLPTKMKKGSKKTKSAEIESKRKRNKNMNRHSSLTDGINSLTLNPIEVSTSKSRNRLFVTYKPGLTKSVKTKPSKQKTLTGQKPIELPGTSNLKPTESKFKSRTRKRSTSLSRQRSRKSRSRKERTPNRPLSQCSRSSNSQMSARRKIKTKCSGLISKNALKALSKPRKVSDPKKRRNTEAMIPDFEPNCFSKRRRSSLSPNRKCSVKKTPKNVRIVDDKQVPGPSGLQSVKFSKTSPVMSDSSDASLSPKLSLSRDNQRKKNKKIKPIGRKSPEKKRVKCRQKQKRHHHVCTKDRVRFDSNINGKHYQLDDVSPGPFENDNVPLLNRQTPKEQAPKVYPTERDLAHHRKQRYHQTAEKFGASRHLRSHTHEMRRCGHAQSPSFGCIIT